MIIIGSKGRGKQLYQILDNVMFLIRVKNLSGKQRIRKQDISWESLDFRNPQGKKKKYYFNFKIGVEGMRKLIKNKSWKPYHI